MVDVYIGIGSNIEPEKNFDAAYSLLTKTYPSIKFSRTFRSSAVGFVGDDFYNSVAKFSINLHNDSLLETLQTELNRLKKIENKLGRLRGDKKFSSRVMDIDILLFGDLICEQPIQLPRGEITENAYVLWPMAEIAPNLKHPTENKSYSELWENFDKSSQKLVVL
ncbi:MAG: 2-amino-4-hydroxy-6-hydroxymethyldihydropteridine diphosphokinase [Kangiellaceae bacterium]